MAINGGILQQGKFTADGTDKILNIRSDVDWIQVYNYTALSQAAADYASVFWFQRGMASGTGIQWTKLGSVTNDPVTIGALTAPNGFQLVNQAEDPVLSSGNAFASFTDATRPVVTSGVTWSASLKAGDVVRFSQTAAQKTTSTLAAWAGIDFQVDAVTANSDFRLANVQQQSPGGTAAGSWRKVNVNSAYYPASRYIVNINVTAPTAPVVTTSIDHGYTVGQVIQFNIPSSLNGMTQLNGLEATITAVGSASQFTCSIDTTGFTAFEFPQLADLAAAGVNSYTPAQVIPVGIETPVAINAGADILKDATDNILVVGVSLNGAQAAATSAGPAGADGDVMYWLAGSSFAVNNE